MPMRLLATYGASPTQPLATVLAVIVLCFSALCSAQDSEKNLPPSDDHHQFQLEGKVGGSAAIRALINISPSENGESNLTGTYHYVNQGKTIHLWGSLNGDRASLEESVLRYGDPVSGRFEGKWSFGDTKGSVTFEGSWTSGDGQRKLPFALKESGKENHPGLDFYHFSEAYSRQRGSRKMQRSHALTLPQLQGTGANIERINGLIRSLALIQLGSSEAQPEPPPSGSTPSLLTLERAVKAILPEKNEIEDLEIGHFESLTFDDEFSVMLNVMEIVSLRMLHSDYTGGAHPNSNAGHVTFDLKSGKELNLDDQMNPGWRDTVTQLAELRLREIYKIKEEEALNEKGPLFESSLALNDNWFLCPEGLGFSFDPYEIGPYSAGFIETVVPYSKLKELVKPGSPLERLVGK
jgi:Protein of unknown function (DUF3298)